ncbi:hypothetical protein [Brevundimonas sp. GCM10030266]|uniref:hypothetical protein n=1 Tax=Brevundimonas sp. GCM10030266 TaxID=3273386 RepID=UPI003605F608
MLVAFLFSLAVIGQDPAPTPAPVTVETPATAAQAQPSPEAAQADAPPAELASNRRDQQIVCRREREIGSNRSRNVCTRVAIDDHNREAARRWYDNVVDSRATPIQTQ